MSSTDLSIIVVGRNDDHGKGFFDRMVACMDFNRRKLNEAGLSVEFVFVDWAFDRERELFSEMLRRKLPWWDTCIAVHRDWQERYKTNPRLAFEEFNAKNVGIRRARGNFILSTNCDIFFSRSLVRFLGKKKMRKDVLYRSLRVDLFIDVGVQRLDYDVLEHPLTISRVNYPSPPLYTNASGDMQLMSRELWGKVRGFNEEVRHTKVHKDSNLCACAHLNHKIPIELVGEVYHIDHHNSLNLVQGKYGPNNELAPYGPNWDWEVAYKNTANWGLGNVPEKSFPGVDNVRFIDFSKN